MSDDGFSFQTGPGRIVVGAFVPSDGPGVPDDRVAAEENHQATAVPLRLLPTRNGYFSAGDVIEIATAGKTTNFRYVDPEQTASRTRVWPDEAA